MEQNINNDVESIGKQLLFINIEDKDLPEALNSNCIQHRIDIKNVSLIKWTKLQNLLNDCIIQYSSCRYILRIYNLLNNEEESISDILIKIKKISESMKCTCDIIRKKEGIFGIYFEFLFKFINTKENEISSGIQKTFSKKYDEIKIGVFGEESSGKSTTTSVIIYNSLDDGKGTMRKKILRFQHEIQSGKTLSISSLVLGVDKENRLVINPENLNEVIKNSTRFINIYDSGGSDKAMKTTLSLISPDYIDYSLLFINYNVGCTENTKKLYSLNVSSHIPVICVISMIDLIENKDEKKLMNFINKCINGLSSINPSIKPLFFTKSSDIQDYISKIKSNINESYLPFICISNVNGNNIDLLKYLITVLPNSSTRMIPLIGNLYENKLFDLVSSPIDQFDVHEHFNVEGKTILGGIVSQGNICKNETYFFGPNKLGNFIMVKVESVHCKKQDVNTAYEGQYSSISLIGKDYNPNEVTKGMCLVKTNSDKVPKAVRRFKADVWWIGTEDIKEIKYKCEPVVIINHIRQSCKIINTTKNDAKSSVLSETENTSESDPSITSKSSSVLANSIELEDESHFFVRNKKKRIKTNLKEEVFFLSRNEKKELVFEFKNSPEYINEGGNIIINDNTFKAFGIITKVLYPDNVYN